MKVKKFISLPVDQKKLQLWQGDCLELMPNIPSNSVDMVLCDLPYGTTACKWDTIIPFEPLWKEYKRVCKHNSAITLFASNRFTYDLISSNLKDYKYDIIWKKNVPTGMLGAKYMPMRYHEILLVFYSSKPTYNPQMKERVQKQKSSYNYNHNCNPSNHVTLDKIPYKYDPNYVQPSSVIEFNTVPNRKGKLHPTQKPVDLCEYLIKTYTNENMTVLDNCMGSGTTGVACKNLNRRFIGIEKDSTYFSIAQERIESAKI